MNQTSRQLIQSILTELAGMDKWTKLRALFYIFVLQVRKWPERWMQKQIKKSLSRSK